MSHTLGQPKEQKSQKMSKNMSKKKKAPKKGESTAGGATESDATELFDRAQEEWETKANTDQQTAHDNAPRSLTDVAMFHTTKNNGSFSDVIQEMNNVWHGKCGGSDENSIIQNNVVNQQSIIDFNQRYMNTRAAVCAF
jgi:hypothetical protein